jgi:hypothetical protein
LADQARQAAGNKNWIDVLPRGLQKVRHFGFAHSRTNVDHAWLEMLVTVTLNSVYVLVVAAPAWPVSPPPTCPTCGGVLRYQGFLATHQERCMTTDTS